MARGKPRVTFSWKRTTAGTAPPHGYNRSPEEQCAGFATRKPSVQTRANSRLREGRSNRPYSVSFLSRPRNPRCTEMTRPPYRLAPSVHWCTLHGFSVILDEENDKYLSIPARQFEALLPYVTSEPSPDTTQHCELPVELIPLTNELLARRILAPDGIENAPRDNRRMPKPERLISTADALVPIGHALRYGPIFIKACTVADCCLRFRAFRKTTSRIRSRKRTIPAPSLEKLVYLSRIFAILRPLYPRSYLCLFDCLALLEFLAYWRQFPSWVFGVAIDPFDAHCWVQHDGVVFCDTHRFGARWYSQILVI